MFQVAKCIFQKSSNSNELFFFPRDIGVWDFPWGGGGIGVIWMVGGGGNIILGARIDQGQGN